MDIYGHFNLLLSLAGGEGEEAGKVEFGGAVGEEQAVHLLLDVGEPGVAKAAEFGVRPNAVHQIFVPFEEFLAALCAVIVPPIAAERIERDAAEFRHEYGLPSVAAILAHEPSPLRREPVVIFLLVFFGEAIAAVCVVVNAHKVGLLDILPAVVGAYKPRLVELLGAAIEGAGEVLHFGIFCDVARAPALVERHIADNAREIAGILNDVAPFGKQPLLLLRVKFIGGRHFAPHDEAELLGVVVVIRVLEFLVLAGAVEAHLHSELDIEAERLRTRGA